MTILVFYFFLVYIKKYAPVKNIFKLGGLTNSYGLSIILTIGSLIGLFCWFYHQTNNPWEEMIPRTSIVFLILMGMGFAVLNSVYEEGLFRGILLTSFTKATNFYIALVLQAVWFSFMHYQAGFPSGYPGLILTFIFGVFTGILVKRSQSIFAPVVIHAISDFFIFILILSRTRGLI
ncbi:CPBP family intramembrane metalloprotease [candidate division KSB1 bacterium]|nr:CPBP family intramembrane metalloprotease [candidate division KSB1 bacterium]